MCGTETRVAAGAAPPVPHGRVRIVCARRPPHLVMPTPPPAHVPRYEPHPVTLPNGLEVDVPRNTAAGIAGGQGQEQGHEQAGEKESNVTESPGSPTPPALRACVAELHFIYREMWQSGGGIGAGVYFQVSTIAAVVRGHFARANT